MACSIEKQINIMKALKFGRPVTSEDVLKIVNKKLDTPLQTIAQVLKEFSGRPLDSFTQLLEGIGIIINAPGVAEPKIVVVNKPVNNIASLFNSPSISELFHTLHVAEGFFESDVNKLIMTAVRVGYEDSNTFVKSDTELNNNMKTLKNSLFETVVRYLDERGQLLNKSTYFKNGVFIAKLYDAKGNFKNYNLFKTVIERFEAYLLRDSSQTIKSYSGKIIPDLRGSIRSSAVKTKLEAYNAAILLVNFDNVIAKSFKDLLKVNYSVYNSFSDPIAGNKYTATVKGFETVYWASDQHMSESADTLEDDLTKRIISLIPQLDKKGAETGNYLETKDFYSLASFIKVLELNNIRVLSKDPTWKTFNEDSKYMMNWYTEHIIEASKNNFTGSKYEMFKNFRHKVDMINSLKSFSDKIAIKEENSTGSLMAILTQVLNNAYGANYSIYNANTHKHESKEMHSHNADKVAMQNSIYAHLGSLATQPEVFKFAKEGDSVATELENIKALTDTDAKLATFIKKTLGISLGVYGASDLREYWTQNGATVEGNIRNYLEGIRTPLKIKELNTLEKIIENEKNITDQNSDESESQSKIINAVSTKVLDVIDTYLDNYILKPITTISTLSGEKIPTFKTTNLTYNDVALLRSRQRIELNRKGAISYESLFLKSGGLLGTSTKLELINKDFNKAAFKFGVLENFTANFEYDFIDAFINPDSKHINVMIGNYSDKNTILAKMIDKSIKDAKGRSIIGDTSGTDILGMQDLRDLVQSQSNKYYSDLFTELFDQYKKLGVQLVNEHDSFNTNITAVNKFLGKFKTNDDLLDFVKSKWINDKTINLQIEHHYSTYADGRIALNQSLVDNYKIFENDVNFNKFIAIQEASLVDKLKAEKGELLFDGTTIEKIKNSTKANKNAERNEKVFDDLLKSFAIDEDAYKGFINKNDEHQITNKKGKTNPLLQRWLLTNALFRNEYLYISVKGEYMHPHKTKLAYRGDSVDINWESLAIENSGRLSSMAKRNVAFTATFELPTRRNKYGIPENVNLAVINDHKDLLYNLSGKTTNQDVHDGSSVINYVYSKMVEASYPGKSYAGTKKQFGTFVSEYGVAIKKDAETELTNDKIRNSNNSSIQFRNLQEQVFGLDMKIDNFYKDGLKAYFYKDGEYFKINKYTIIDNQLEVELSKYNRTTGKFEFLGKQAPVKVKNLFDIWEVFGGEYSVDADLKKFNENSNDVLYELTTSYEVDGNYPLKNAMIHIVSNASSMKAGATNINPSKNWSDGGTLSYSQFEHRHMGPQLDANHHADASKIKEITQIISALSQNEKTAHLSNEVYEDLARIINEAASPYIKSIDKLDETKMQQLYMMLSKEFAKTLANSTNVNLAHTIAESFDQGAVLPFSNQHFFQEFVRSMISKMNKEFITRYYSGIGAILNPSHGIVQLFEDTEGNVYKQEDITQEAFAKYVPVEGVVKTSKQIINEYIRQKFPDTKVDASEIQPGDIISQILSVDGVDYNVPFALDTPKKYQDFKRIHQGKVTKVNSTPRDLKPSGITFNVVKIDKNGINLNHAKNIFDTDSVRLRFILNDLNAKGLTPEDKLAIEATEDYTILNNFAKGFDISLENIYNADKNIKEATIKKIDNLLNAWTQRNLQLLDNHFIMNSVNVNTDFKQFFGPDTLTELFDDVKAYWDTNSQPVTNYKFHAAELVLPNIYQSDFSNEMDTINDIRTKGALYFRDKLTKEFEVDDINYDLKFNLKEGEHPVYVKYVTELPAIKEEDNAFETTLYDNMKFKITKFRLNTNGERLYEKPENSVVKVEDNYDVIYLKIGELTTLPGEGNKDKKIVLDKYFKSNLKGLVKSFRNEISSIVPLMNNTIDNIVDINKEGVISPFNTNDLSYAMFAKFAGYKATPGKLSSEWFGANKESILDQLANKMYASWEKSQQFIVARIPSQSMQSFMEMKNIGYFNTKSNDAYVSVWQIWIQGSDFDIDKAYVMGYGFNKSSQYETWTNLASYSNSEELSELEKLPVPTGKLSTLNQETGLDVNKQFEEFVNITKIPADADISEIDLNFNELKIVGEALRNLKNSKKTEVKITAEDQKYANLFLALINKHNMFTDFLDGKNAVKNSVIAKIKQVISMPSNQLLANEPVDVKSLHDAADKAGADVGAKLLSSWDMVSYFKQQRDAAVGKDDVGIGANGLKVFFSLSNYYNDWYKKLNDNHLIDSSLQLRTNPKSFKKSFTINGEKRDIHTIADTKVSQEYINKIVFDYGYDALHKDLKVYNSNAALFMSAFVSGATDNAKELVMAKINAVSELAGMHLYMLGLGISMDDVAKYMNSDIVKSLLKSLSQNSFNNTDKIFIPSLIKSYKSEHSEDANYSEAEMSTFLDIYGGGQEFKVLARLLKINQKTAANTQELNKFLSTFEFAVYARENAVLSEKVKSMRDEERWEYKKGDEPSIIDTILAKNLNFSDTPELYRDHVTNVLTRANNIKVEVINELGLSEEKYVSMVGGQFDFRYYMNPKNIEYRETAVEYYNLFKNTINIFDVIENSPHFKAMIDGVSIIHNILLISSKKYNFMFSKARNIIRENSETLQKNNKNVIKTWQGNSAFPIVIDDKVLGRNAVTYDKFLVSSWLKSNGKISNYQFNVGSWLKAANMKSIDMYVDDSSKVETVGSFQAKDRSARINGKFITVTADSNYTLDLSSDTGVSNFKMLMEQVGMRILNLSQTSNLSNSLKLTSMKNPFGLFTTQITSSFGISSLNSPINLDKFQELLNDFNAIDRSIEPALKIKNTSGANVDWQDLFYLYNLFVNNESYGDKRLTPLFEDYIKQKQSIGWDYLNFSSKVDSGKINIFEIPDTGDAEKNIELKNNQDNAIMFLAFHKNGTLKMSRNKTGAAFEITLKNSNYVINTLMDVTSNKDVNTNITMNAVLATLRNKNLLINFNCN